MTTDPNAALLRAFSHSEQTWMTRCQALDRELLLSVLDQIDAAQWAYSTVLDRAYRLESCTYAQPGTPDQQDAITALLGARVVAPGHYRYLDVDGWPPQLYVPMLFITSMTGRALLDELRGER
ncbi:hypothetical protein [Lentzea sp. NPDC060358]|uniref:hypothetical protein n=1 Tax=Lentzea sp. NPDC060358 TaxID=3347103 RepID=UPI00364A2212